jgi:hypothetical protein
MYARRGEAAVRHRAGERIVTQQWKGSDLCDNVHSETVASGRSAAGSNGLNSIEQG